MPGDMNDPPRSAHRRIDDVVRIRLHAVPVFVAVIGGLIAFGASGAVLGPLLLAITDALVGLWRRRMGLGAGGA